MPFAHYVADYYQLPLDFIDLTPENFWYYCYQSNTTDTNPTFIPCSVAKYGLADITKHVALTGEGGDTLFAGVKNNFVLFMSQQHPSLPLSWIYALSHKRFFLNLPDILRNGTNLFEFVMEYFTNIFSKYPGSLIRKLFYINTFLKQGSLIFPTSYNASKRNNSISRHPLTSLAVYKTAFSIDEKLHYTYPNGKLALIKTFYDELPKSIIYRKKRGTYIPLPYKLSHKYHKDNLPFKKLKKLNIFKDSFIDKCCSSTVDDQVPLLVLALNNLEEWFRAIEVL